MHTKLVVTLLTAVIASAMLVGCGQKGPLYLPETEQTAEH